MLRFKDFVPKLIEAGGFFQAERYESTEQCLIRLNNYIEDNNLNVMNIETVILPNIFLNNPGRTDAPAFSTHSGTSGRADRYHPVFRVWYSI